MLKKQNHFIQTLVREFQNDLILPVSRVGFYGARYEEGRVCVFNNSLSKYMTNDINPTSNRNNIARGCEISICAFFSI